MVLQDLMERGIKVAGGDLLGKTIIFAQNKKHAEFILELFNKLYPQYKGTFAQRIICDDAYAQTIIDDFKVPDKEPRIAVSVDMMDTGIDVPECVNLVFFKKVRSKTKFWQMIGRGTRLAPDLECFDQSDGPYIGKRRFLIFDYCGNFEFFRTKPNGFEGKETKSLSENIFGKKIQIMSALQSATFADDSYQEWRKSLVSECHKQVERLNSDIISVRLKREFVEKYKKEEAFDSLSEGDKGELIDKIASLVFFDDEDEFAKRFDNFMYGLMILFIEGKPSFKQAKKQLCEIALALENKISVPQVKEMLPEIKIINTDAYWAASDVLQFEKTRKDLRNLIKFLVGGEPKKPIITRLTDPVIDQHEGVQLDAAYDFEVNRYITENGNSIAIYKLTHNIPLTAADYKELQRVFTQELGTQEDYEREYGDTPFGLLIRKIAKLDHDAAMEAFSAFINDASLNQKQIAFFHKIISHVEKNGYMEDIKELQKPPFDKPVSFIKLFDAKRRVEILKAIQSITENATKIVG